MIFLFPDLEWREYPPIEKEKKVRSFICFGLMLCLMLPVKAEETTKQEKKRGLTSQFLQYHDLLTLKLNELNQSLTIPYDVKRQLSAKIKENMIQLNDIHDKIEALGLLYGEAIIEKSKQKKLEEETESNHKNDQSVREEMEYLDEAAKKEKEHLQKEMDKFLKDVDQLQKNISAFKTEKFAKTLEGILTSAMEKISDFIQELKEKKE